MRLKPFFLFILGLLLLHCTPDREDPFLIGKDRIGKLMRTHRISSLDSVFQGDSLIRDTTRIQMGVNGKIEVFEKGGMHLLTLTPATDSIRGIENIHIRDPRYHTPEGISLESSFGDIEGAYEIRKVMSSLNNILILIKDSPVYFTFSREDLPAALRYTNTPIEAVQIPDEAKIKYIMVGWE